MIVVALSFHSHYYRRIRWVSSTSLPLDTVINTPLPIVVVLWALVLRAWVLRALSYVQSSRMFSVFRTLTTMYHISFYSSNISKAIIHRVTNGFDIRSGTNVFLQGVSSIAGAPWPSATYALCVIERGLLWIGLPSIGHLPSANLCVHTFGTTAQAQDNTVQEELTCCHGPILQLAPWSLAGKWDCWVGMDTRGGNQTQGSLPEFITVFADICTIGLFDCSTAVLDAFWWKSRKHHQHPSFSVAILWWYSSISFWDLNLPNQSRYFRQACQSRSTDIGRCLWSNTQGPSVCGQSASGLAHFLGSLLEKWGSFGIPCRRRRHLFMP